MHAKRNDTKRKIPKVGLKFSNSELWNLAGIHCTVSHAQHKEYVATASSSVPYVAITLSFILFVVPTLSSIPYVATTSSSITMLLQPDPLFLMWLQPYPQHIEKVQQES